MLTRAEYVVFRRPVPTRLPLCLQSPWMALMAERASRRRAADAATDGDGLELAFCSQPVIDVVTVHEPFLREELVCAHRDLSRRYTSG